MMSVEKVTKSKPAPFTNERDSDNYELNDDRLYFQNVKTSERNTLYSHVA